VRFLALVHFKSVYSNTFLKHAFAFVIHASDTALWVIFLLNKTNQTPKTQLSNTVSKLVTDKAGHFELNYPVFH